MGIKALLEAPLVGNARAAFGASWARRAFDGPVACGNNSIGVLFSIHGGMGEVVYARRAQAPIFAAALARIWPTFTFERVV